MELNGFWPVFFGGMLGPVLVELVKIASWHNVNTVAAKYRRWDYWVATVALLLVSGIVTVINGIDHVTLQRAVQLGINAPAIVAAYATGFVSKTQRRRQHAMNEGQHFDEPEGILPRMAELLSW